MKPKRKAIVCDMDKPEEKELWEWLQTLSHGQFSEVTKNFWFRAMKDSIRLEKKFKGE
jgi:hypothetical protein